MRAENHAIYSKCIWENFLQYLTHAALEVAMFLLVSYWQQLFTKLHLNILSHGVTKQSLTNSQTISIQSLDNKATPEWNQTCTNASCMKSSTHQST